MSPETIEEDVALYLLSAAADMLEGHHHQEDVDAAICAVFATALEFATKRKLRPIDELFQ